MTILNCEDAVLALPREPPDYAGGIALELRESVLARVVGAGTGDDGQNEILDASISQILRND